MTQRIPEVDILVSLTGGVPIIQEEVAFTIISKLLSLWIIKGGPIIISQRGAYRPICNPLDLGDRTTIPDPALLNSVAWILPFPLLVSSHVSCMDG